MQKQISKEINCDTCLKRAKLMFDYYKRNADEETKYVTIVFSLGYVAMTTIYSTMYQYLSIKNRAVFIICLFISLFTFIMNEIWKMIMGILENKHENELWSKNFKNQITLNELERQTRIFNAKQFEIYNKVYPAIFVVSSIAGLIAAFVLFKDAISLTF